MHISRRQFVIGGSASSLLALSGCAASIGEQQSYLTGVVNPQLVDPVFQWTDVALQALRDQIVAPPLATRGLAMGHVAGFLAVNGIEGAYHNDRPLPEAPAGADPAVAYGVAFSHAIAEHFQQPFVGDRLRFLSAFPDGDAKSVGIKWGENVAGLVVRERTNDGAEPNKVNFYLNRYSRRTDSLRWTPTGPLYDAGEGPAFKPTFHRALLPGFGAVKPWAIGATERFRAPPFPHPASRAFADAFEEVKILGASDSAVRTGDQAQIAVFWEDGPWGITPPGHFALIAIQLLQHRRMRLVDRARAFALISMAMADAGISAWDSKYAYDVIRPETAIRYRVPKFGNPDPRVSSDPSWKSYIPTPPFPAYTSGHSTFGSAGARMTAHILGRDDIAFSGPSPDLVIWPKHLQGVTRHWPSLSAAAEENGLSRIYGGVHWRQDHVEGMRAGRRIADHIFKTAFRRRV